MQLFFQFPIFKSQILCHACAAKRREIFPFLTVGSCILTAAKKANKFKLAEPGRFLLGES